MNSRTVGALALASALAFASTPGHAIVVDINASVTNGVVGNVDTGLTQLAVGSTFSGASFHLVNTDGVAQAEAVFVTMNFSQFGTPTSSGGN